MNNSLREQLLRTGLVSKERVNEVEKQAKSKVHQEVKERKKKQGVAVPVDTEAVAYLVAQAREEETARTKELNRQREAERQKKELWAQARQLIEFFHLNEPDANLTYYFTEGKWVRHILVNAKQRHQLACGQLGIGVLDEHYYLLPVAVVEKLLERVPEAVVWFNHGKEEKVESNDPYAAYHVPEDLVW